MLGGLKLLLNATRLFSDGRERRLPNLLHASREAQAEISTKLATQVLGALHELLRGLHAADRERVGRLAAQRPAHLYEGLLTVLLRLIFLLYGEDRNLFPSRADGPAQALYQEGYGVRSLHAKLLADRAGHPDTMEERRGAWGRLLALFRLVHGGDGTGWIRSRGGKLFDPGSFPFLEGRDNGDDRPAPPHVTDGCVLRVLDGLLVLGGEKLSYRTLDVQHIGSVYETVMGFTVLAMPGPALAIKAGKNNRTPVFVDLAALVAKRGEEREKFLKDEADRTGQLPDRVVVALAVAPDAATLAETLRPIVDERGSPHGPVPPGTPLLQPTDERRRTGSHYTPRSLTEPIIRHALEPAFARLGPGATPEQVLALKVCDPAMGSGAFLVEACRQLATRLVAAWTRHAATRPVVAEDEDEDLLARRLVAQRCLYGVDRNPLAADLARLSLWLATLAREHEFTFLDHALKSGDSLVGLSARQISGLRWQDGQTDVAPFDGFLRERIAQVTEGRLAIREAPDDVARAIQEQRFRHVESLARQVRLLGDATLAAFFGADTTRAREQARVRLGIMASLSPEQSWPRVAEAAAALVARAGWSRPFHWEIEFPEVFFGPNVGFDAVIGNPPFLGGKQMPTALGPIYCEYLKEVNDESVGAADLCAYFFRRGFRLMRTGGALGLLATNTISETATRKVGLDYLLTQGATIYRARTNFEWPGEASVVVSQIHIFRGPYVGQRNLDGTSVTNITSLLTAYVDLSAAKRLTQNIRYSEGVKLYDGGAFVIQANDLDNIISNNPGLKDYIRIYVNGDVLNDTPDCSALMYALDFGERDEAQIIGCDAVLAHLKRYVAEARIGQTRQIHEHRPWLHWDKRTAFFNTARQLDRVVAVVIVSAQYAFHMVDPKHLYAHGIKLFADNRPGFWGILQSRVHETWARAITSSRGRSVRYTTSSCFDTFPSVGTIADNTDLNLVSQKYIALRGSFLAERGIGTTELYKDFHNPARFNEELEQLRELHHRLDVAALQAFGSPQFLELASRAKPKFLNEGNEPDRRYHGRLFWPASFREEVLARLLDANFACALNERARGVLPALLGEDEDNEDEAA